MTNKPYITRCQSHECQMRAECLRNALPCHPGDNSFDYDQERGNGKRCHAFIRVTEANVKAVR